MLLKRLLTGFMSVVLTISLGLGAAWMWAKERYQAPLGTTQVRVDIPRGAGLNRISHILFQQGVLPSQIDGYVFLMMVTAARQGASLQAGEYDIPADSSMAAITDILRTGKNRVHYPLTVPEGLTSPEVLRLISSMPELDGTVSLKPATGTLLPETYALLRGDQRDDAVRRMQAAMDKAISDLWAQRAPDLPLKNKEQAIILASVVEKETGLPAERPRVAAVFINRLRVGMPLQSDPTVIYGLAPETGTLGRALLRSDLETDHPWNTYTRSGLPASPIANPGLASLTAVLHPASTKELYFVADGTGGHAFANTLAEHNKNVAAWKKLQR